MTEPVESVLQKSREEFEKWMNVQNIIPDYAVSGVKLLWEAWQASRSALEPMLAELSKYKAAIEKHLCVYDAADWLACSCEHEVCVQCSVDNGIIPMQSGCFHEILKLTKERAEAAEQALREAQAELQKRDKCAFIGPMRDCPTHGESQEFKNAKAENEKLREWRDKFGQGCFE